MSSISKFIKNTLKHKDIKDKNLTAKVNIFVKFLDLADNTENIKQELERVAINEGMVSFPIIANLTAFFTAIAHLKFKNEATINEFSEQADILVKLKITKKPITLNDITKKTILEENNPDKIYYKMFYLAQNITEFKDGLAMQTYLDYLTDLLLAYLNITYHLKKEIYDLYFLKTINIKQYLSDIIKAYESKINFKYIPASIIKLENSWDQNAEINDFNSFLDINANEKIKKIKLIGYAGAGKTTTLEYIQYLDALNYEQKQKLPVLINLITINKNKPIENIIMQKLNITDNDLVNYILSEHKINLYLDGINELSITDMLKKHLFLDNLEEFLNRKELANLRVIVTDRDNDEISVLNNHPTFLIQGMNNADALEFIKGNAEKEKVDLILKSFQNSSLAKENTIEPLMLKNFIKIIECGGVVPESTEELTSYYLEALINREITEKHDNLANFINPFLENYVNVLTSKLNILTNIKNTCFISSYFN